MWMFRTGISPPAAACARSLSPARCCSEFSAGRAVLPWACLVCASGTARWKMTNANINLGVETTAWSFFTKLHFLPINLNSSCCSKALIRGKSFHRSLSAPVKVPSVLFCFSKSSVEKGFHWESSLCSVKAFIQLLDSVRRLQGVRRVVEFSWWYLLQSWKGSLVFTDRLWVGPWSVPLRFMLCKCWSAQCFAGLDSSSSHCLAMITASHLEINVSKNCLLKCEEILMLENHSSNGGRLLASAYSMQMKASNVCKQVLLLWIFTHYCSEKICQVSDVLQNVCNVVSVSGLDVSLRSGTSCWIDQ